MKTPRRRTVSGSSLLLLRMAWKFEGSYIEKFIRQFLTKNFKIKNKGAGG